MYSRHHDDEREDFYRKLAGYSAHYDRRLTDQDAAIENVSLEVKGARAELKELSEDVRALTRVELKKANRKGRDFGAMAGAVAAGIVLVLQALVPLLQH